MTREQIGVSGAMSEGKEGRSLLDDFFRLLVSETWFGDELGETTGIHFRNEKLSPFFPSGRIRGIVRSVRRGRRRSLVERIRGETK
jgi:hypothetical protein